MTGVGAGAVLATLANHARLTGSFEVIRVGEFKTPPPNGLSFAVWMQTLGVAPTGSGLAATTALLHATARIHLPMLYQPEDGIEVLVADAADAYMGRLHGAFTLGGLVRDVDLLGEMGEPMLWQYGYITIGQAIYRIAELQIYAVLNDVWTQAP
jgi:hypothetical protein